MQSWSKVPHRSISIVTENVPRRLTHSANASSPLAQAVTLPPSLVMAHLDCSFCGHSNDATYQFDCWPS